MEGHDAWQLVLFGLVRVHTMSAASATARSFFRSSLVVIQMTI